MTITSTPSEVSYAGDGVSTVFPIPFVFDTSADLKVIETVSATGVPTVVTSGFSIGGGGGGLGTLTRSPALPAGTNITILDNPALTQPVDYQDNDAFPAATHEAALDRVTRITKRLSERVDRSLRVADGDLVDGDNNILPISGARAGKFMVFGASGLPTVATGTGNDSSLRADLAAGTANLVDSRAVSIIRTAAEIAAGVTLAAAIFLPGVVDRYGTNTTPGTTDMTQAIKNAYAAHVAGGPPVQFQGDRYLVTDTCITITNAQPRVQILGVPLRTVLINKAGASKATIDIQGGQYWDIRGLVLIGATGFVNKGIYLHKDGAGVPNRCAYFNIQDVVCQTNGVGIHIQDTNSGYITNYQYWPSGGGSFGGSIDTNSRTAGLLADGTSAVNSIHVRNFNGSGLNTIAADATAAMIKLDATAAGAPFQMWTFESVEAENPGTRAMWFRNCNGCLTTTVFHENTEVRIDAGSVRNTFVAASGAATGTVVISATGGVCRQQSFTGCSAASITVDPTCSENSYEDCNYPIAPGLSDTNNVSLRNCETTGSVLMSDRSSILWTTPAFSAGDYTSSAGSWTVASGDVTTCEYIVQGKLMCLNLTLDTTTVAGGPAALRRVIPGGFTAAKSGYFPIIATQDNGTTTLIAIARLIAGSTIISFQRDLAATAWSNVTDLNGIHASLRFEIQ